VCCAVVVERKNAIFHKNAHKSILLLLSEVERERERESGKEKKKCCPHLEIISAMNYLTLPLWLVHFTETFECIDSYDFQ
jgi:hypothetical protein